MRPPILVEIGGHRREKAAARVRPPFPFLGQHSLSFALRPNGRMLTVEALLSYRFAVPRTIFFTLRLAEPRGTVRLAFGAAFLRAVRFALLRSSLLSDFVFAMIAFLD